MRLLLAILFLLFALPASAQQGQGMSQAMVVSSCGGGALPSGALSQLTMDTTGRLCQSGIGSNVCSQATAYLARTTGGNEGGNAVNITALICGLVSDGVIDGTLTGATGCGSHLDALYILAQQNAADSLLNLCGTSYTATNVGSATFTTYNGYSGWGNTTYLNTNINPSVGGVQYTVNSANMGVWVYTIVAGTGVDIGADVAVENILTSFSGSFYARVNGNNSNNVPTPGTKGLFVGDRSSSASVVPYWNGVSQGTQTSSSTALISAFFQIGNLLTNPVAHTLSEAHIGGSLGTAGNLALYNRLRTYMSAVGVP